jgi:hypothetical protein
MNEQKKIKVELFYKEFEGSDKEIRFSDLPKNLDENHIIDIQRESSDEYDYTLLVVEEERFELPCEYEKRLKEQEATKEYLKTIRYKQYLKLKKEFE